MKARKLCLVLIVLLLPFTAAADEGAAAAEVAAPKSKLERTRDIIQQKAHASKESASPAERPDPVSSWPKMVQGLLLCLGLFSVFVYFMKKGKGLSPSQSSSRMRIVERMAISSKASVALIEVDDQQLLVALSGDRITPLPLAREESVEAATLSLAHSEEAVCVGNS